MKYPTSTMTLRQIEALEGEAADLILRARVVESRGEAHWCQADGMTYKALDMRKIAAEQRIRRQALERRRENGSRRNPESYRAGPESDANNGTATTRANGKTDSGTHRKAG